MSIFVRSDGKAPVGLSDLTGYDGMVERVAPKACKEKSDTRSHPKDGGAYRDRTDDPLLAKQVLSQLS